MISETASTAHNSGRTKGSALRTRLIEPETVSRANVLRERSEPLEVWLGRNGLGLEAARGVLVGDG